MVSERISKRVASRAAASWLIATLLLAAPVTVAAPGDGTDHECGVAESCAGMSPLPHSTSSAGARGTSRDRESSVRAGARKAPKRTRRRSLHLRHSSRRTRRRQEVSTRELSLGEGGPDELRKHLDESGRPRRRLLAHHDAPPRGARNRVDRLRRRRTAPPGALREPDRRRPEFLDDGPDRPRQPVFPEPRHQRANVLHLSPASERVDDHARRGARAVRIDQRSRPDLPDE